MKTFNFGILHTNLGHNANLETVLEYSCPEDSKTSEHIEIDQSFEVKNNLSILREIHMTFPTVTNGVVQNWMF